MVISDGPNEEVFAGVALHKNGEKPIKYDHPARMVYSCGYQAIVFHCTQYFDSKTIEDGYQANDL